MYSQPIRDERAGDQRDETFALTGSMICSNELDPAWDTDDRREPPVPGRVVSVYIPAPKRA